VFVFASILHPYPAYPELKELDTRLPSVIKSPVPIFMAALPV
jgi:hypothetical protein